MSIENEEVVVAPMASPIGMTLTPELLQMILQQSNLNTLEAIREMRRPSEQEQEKIERERKQSMELTMRRVASARKSEDRQATAWRNCSHRQPNGKTRFRGQVNSNGFAQAFCPECQFLSEPFKAYPHELMGGLNISDWQGDVFALVQQRIKSSPPVDAIPDAPAGARVMFD